MPDCSKIAVSDSFIQISALSDSYNLLALLTQFPANSFCEGLSDGSLKGDMASILVEIGVNEDALFDRLLELMDRAAEDAAQNEILGELRREYTRLFNHPDQPVLCICEELYLHVRKIRLLGKERSHDKEPRMFVCNASLDAERCYKAAGFARTNPTGAPSDSMFVEMEYVANLLSLAAKAELKDLSEEFEEAILRLHEFDRLHLDKWMRLFYRDCLDVSVIPFYQALGCFGLLVHGSTKHFLENCAAR